MIHVAPLSDETKRNVAFAPNLIREVSEINSLINEPAEYYSSNPMNKSIEEKINEMEILLETTNTS